MPARPPEAALRTAAAGEHSQVEDRLAACSLVVVPPVGCVTSSGLPKR